MLRLLASQHAPELRRRLVLGCIRRVRSLAASGIHLGDDLRLSDALTRMAGLRGLVSDALADLALEARHAIFEGPRLEREAERTTKEVAGWLEAAEFEASPPPASVLTHLASAPRNVFERVGRRVSDPDPRLRGIAVAAHVRRFYAPSQPASHTSGSVGDVLLERLDLLDGRIVLGSVSRPGDLAPTLERLARAAAAAGVRVRGERIHAIELIVPIEAPGVANGALAGALAEAGEAVANAVAAQLREPLSTRLVNLTLRPPTGPLVHRSFAWSPDGMVEVEGLHGIHPEAANRIDLERLRNFELERLEAPDDIYAFHLRSRDIDGDERILVLADVRGRSPDEGHEAELHEAAFERDFHEACRCLRGHLGARDPRRRLQWNRIALFAAPAIYLDAALVERLAQRLAPATRHLGLEKVVVRLNVLDRDTPGAPARAQEIVISDPTGSQMELMRRAPHHDPLRPASEYERRVVEARRRRLVYPYEIVRMLSGGAGAKGEEARIPAGRFEEYDLDPIGARPAAVSVAGRPYGRNESAIVFGVIDTPTEWLPEGLRRVQ